MGTIPTTITVPVTTVSTGTLYLREQLACATADDGTEIVLDKSGGVLIFTLVKTGGEKVRQTLTVEALVTAWAGVWGVK